MIRATSEKDARSWCLEVSEEINKTIAMAKNNRISWNEAVRQLKKHANTVWWIEYNKSEDDENG